MGHKVNPRGIRLGITTNWRAQWYAKPKDYARVVNSDLKARAYLEKALKPAGVSTILIAREANSREDQPHYLIKVTAYVARPGIVIGKKGGLVEQIKKELETILISPIYLSIQEVRKPEIDPKLIAENIANQIVNQSKFYRRAMKRAVSTAMRMGALGIKVRIAGRLGGTEIARDEVYQEGRMPLHEFRANIDRDFATANTSSGIIGVTVWIHKKIITVENPKSLNFLGENTSKPVQKDREWSFKKRNRALKDPAKS